MDRCTFTNSDTGHQCDMAMFHFGPHRMRSGHKVVEEWVVPCAMEPCDYHENSDQIGNEWEECINCGKKRPVREHERPLPKVKRHKRFTYFIGNGIRCITILLTSNKSLEVQWGRFKPAPYVFTFQAGWNRCCDHAGPEIEVGVWGFHLMLKMYDVRHWDYDNNRWDNHD